jgi:hypothetical protein
VLLPENCDDDYFSGIARGWICRWSLIATGFVRLIMVALAVAGLQAVLPEAGQLFIGRPIIGLLVRYEVQSNRGN